MAIEIVEKIVYSDGRNSFEIRDKGFDVFEFVFEDENGVKYIINVPPCDMEKIVDHLTPKVKAL